MKPFPGEVRISSARASNDKWALAQQIDGWINLHTIAGKFERVLPRDIRSDTQPVWSRTDSDHVFTVDGINVWKRHVLTDWAGLVVSFPQFVSLSAAHAEGDLTPDGWLALCGIGVDGVEHAFVYNVDTGKSGDVRQLAEPIDGIKAAKDGWLLVSSARGIQAYPLVGPGHLLTTANGHASTAVHKGRPVLIWCNSDENPITLPDFPNAAVMVDIETGKQTGLKPFDWAYAMHTSGEIISVYDPADKLPNQIWRTPLDGSTPTLLHEWKAVYVGYESTPRASYSGSHVLFNIMEGRQSNVSILEVSPTEDISIPALPEDGLIAVNLENEADADYVMELPVRGGKALPWKMFKRTL